MTGNPSFPAPNPDLALVSSAETALNVAIAAAANRDSVAIADRNTKYGFLYDLLNQLGDNVQDTAKGDKDIILSSGFEVRKTPEPIGILPAPQDVNSDLGSLDGSIAGRWRAIYGAGIYVVEINETDPNDEAAWSFALNSTKSRVLVEDLDPGKLYYLRIAAIGAAGQGPWSEVSNSRAR